MGVGNNNFIGLLHVVLDQSVIDNDFRFSGRIRTGIGSGGSVAGAGSSGVSRRSRFLLTGIVVCGSAAGRKREGHGQNQQQSKQFLHVCVFLFMFLIYRALQ